MSDDIIKKDIKHLIEKETPKEHPDNTTKTSRWPMTPMQKKGGKFPERYKKRALLHARRTVESASRL